MPNGRTRRPYVRGEGVLEATRMSPPVGLARA